MQWAKSDSSDVLIAGGWCSGRVGRVYDGRSQGTVSDAGSSSTKQRGSVAARGSKEKERVSFGRKLTGAVSSRRGIHGQL